MSILPLFATPVYASVIKEPHFSLVQAEFRKTYDALAKENAFGDPWNNGRILISNKSFDVNLLLRDNCATFMKCLDDHVKSYLAGIGVNNPKYKVMSSWMTLSRRYAYAHVHEHAPSDISGVYYYQTNGEDGNLFFKNPTPLATSPFFMHIDNSIFRKPEVGHITLWPSWLSHGVETNLTDSERISVSFNLLATDY